ncbi:methyltransferase [Nitrosovibrio tenuis]|uniref:Ubiquinone/menaquinone biosynthesis C-methylase UbiE n=1 Tax=Nitrosovibrio tenuis TaxID=1233 RepID=A0A1H7I334_9PROT|nr:methyltransferase [Nitrosovibrio tenuis]SEK56921.1 Ubiquinone/menaquinone biosynthesis C-methylase UbiE [Nitrosovibrio tenuis]
MDQEKFVDIPRPRIDDRPLWDVMFGVFGNPALLIAHRLKVFTLLGQGARTLPDICNTLNIKTRPAEAMLTTATALGFLSLHDGHYALTPLSEDYLLEKSPSYFGFFWDMMIDNSEVFSYASLEKAVLTDCPQAYGGGDIYKSHEEQAELARRFTRGMHSISMTLATAWPNAVDLSGIKLMLDIGGGSGAHSIGAALRWNDLKALILDLEPICEVAQEFVIRYGLQDRIGTQVADMWNDPFPEADLHFYSNIYHDWPPEKCHFLTEKSFRCLEPGGRIIIHDVLYNDDKTGPFAPAAYSMLMMGWTEGKSYSGLELSGMLKGAGFHDIEVHPTFGYYSIVTALKP